MIEPARIVTGGKINTSVNAAITNINFWNDLHRLGLTGFRQTQTGAAWTLANCVLTVREVEANVAEMHLLVAHRQNDYRWYYGLQPDDTASQCWNQILLLWPHDTWGDGYQQVGPSLPRVSLDLLELVEGERMSEFARLVHLGETAHARYGQAPSEVHWQHMDKIEQEVKAARLFKREQEALQDLTPEQLARVYFALLPSSTAPPIASAERTEADVQPMAGNPAHPQDAHAESPVEESKPRLGRSTLDHAEVIYRLAKAQQAEEIKARDPDARWKEIAKEIEWRLGTDKSAIKLLEDARHRLERVRKNGDQATLSEIEKFRKEKKIRG